MLQEILTRIEVCAEIPFYYKAPGNSLETILGIWVKQDNFRSAEFDAWVESVFGPLFDAAIKEYPM